MRHDTDMQFIDAVKAAAFTRKLAQKWRDKADDWPDLSDMYLEDAADADRIADLLEAGKFTAAFKAVSRLDTSPREHYDWYYDPEDFV